MKSIFCLIAAVGLATSIFQLPAVAQSKFDSNTTKVSVQFDNADIRYALKQLFQSAGVNFTLDSSVEGRVTASLTDVSFKAALESILKSSASIVKLTYRVEGGIYNIAPKQEDAPLVTKTDEPKEDEKKRPQVTTIHLNFADVEDVTRALGGTVIQTRFSGTFGILGGTANGANGGRGGAGNGLNGNGQNSNGNGFGNGQNGGGNNVGGLNPGNGTTIVQGPHSGNSGGNGIRR